jgi:Galactose oxidase, central domain
VATGNSSNPRHSNRRSRLAFGLRFVASSTQKPSSGNSSGHEMKIFSPKRGHRALVGAVATTLWLLVACRVSARQTGMTTPPRMNFAHDHVTAILLSNGKVLIAGGDGTGATDLYGPASNSFAAAKLMPKMDADRESATVTLLPGGKVLIAGGYGEKETLASTELYDPAYNCFAGQGGCPDKTVPPPMNVARADATATLLPNGKVLIAGGYNSDSGYLKSAELYDPVHNCIAGNGGCPDRAIPAAMNSARSEATATLLRNGKVLIAGGNAGYPVVSNGHKIMHDTPLNSTELYDPQSNSFAPARSTPTMNSARKEATAMLLPNDKVLIIGGRDMSDESLNTTELYDPANNCFAGGACPGLARK